MTEQENIETVTRFREAWDGNDIDPVMELVSPDLVAKGPRGTIEGRDAWRAVITQAPLADEPSHLESTRVEEELDACADVVVSTSTRVVRWKENGEVAHSQRNRVTFTFGEDGEIVEIQLEPNIGEA